MTQNAGQHVTTANLLGSAAQVLAISATPSTTQDNTGALNEYQGGPTSPPGALTRASRNRRSATWSTSPTPRLPGLLRRRGRLDDDGNLVYGYDVGDRHMVALHFYCEALPPPRHLQWLRR